MLLLLLLAVLSHRTACAVPLHACFSVAMIESPIPQDDIQGNAHIRASQPKPIAMHFGTPSFLEGIRAGLPDAFVIGGTIEAIL